ncbi:MAG: globin domain-containing protein [Gammaproteobacteria bacterium]
MENVSQETRKILKDTEHILWDKQVEVTNRMYEILFEKYPETKLLFKNFRSQQPNIFAAALMAHMLSLDEPEALLSFRVGISRSHVAAGVEEKHYPMLADALMSAMRELLADKMDDKTLIAWEKWYYFLANLLIEREREHYEQKHLLFPE